MWGVIAPHLFLTLLQVVDLHSAAAGSGPIFLLKSSTVAGPQAANPLDHYVDRGSPRLSINVPLPSSKAVLSARGPPR